MNAQETGGPRVKGTRRSKKALKNEARTRSFFEPWGYDKVYVPPRVSQKKRRRLERQRHR